jgi:hypothetical protein
MLKSAEKLGNMLASNIPSNGSPKASSITGLIFFQIKPFKDNDREVNHRDTVSKNLISLKKKKMIFIISGNATDIKMYVGIPKNFK